MSIVEQYNSQVATEVGSFSTVKNFLTVTRASAKMNLINQMRYKQNFIAQFVRTFIYILIFYLFSISFEFTDGNFGSTSVRYTFIFFISGLSFLMYDGVALWGPYNIVQNDLYNGTLEAIYQTPGSRYAYYFGGVLARSIYSSAFFIPLFLTMLVVLQPPLLTISITIVVIITTIASLISMGIIIGLLAVLFKQAGTIIGILGTLIQFITGALIPLNSLPWFIRYTGFIFPFTWGYDLLRYYIYQGTWQPLFPIWMEWMILGSILAIYTIISVILLRKVEQYSKKKGLHLI